MNIETLKIFCLVVDTGSISQAAKLSYVSQPAVSKQINQLETYYHALLFNRSDGRLTLTESGKVLYPFAKVMVADFNRSKAAVSDNLRGFHDSLKVGASLTIGEYLLPGMLGDFKTEYHNVNVSLMVENTPQVIDALLDDVIDLALVEGIVQTDKLIVEEFAEDELVFIHSPKHPWKDRESITINELTSEQMLWREPTSGTRLIIENFLQELSVLDKIQSYMDLGSTQAIKSAVEAGLGISIVSKLTVARELEQGTLFETKVKDVDFKRNLWLVKKKQRFRKNSVDMFESFIKGKLIH
ncbi:LysR family transcriptional regulator [Oceanobacillus kapialis]|uniref:LysR family transcriptional regulator n=1 Tax=Oceanobacillus kapialis TaxID=481353 RepID=A0ABW5PW80_9BACI